MSRESSGLKHQFDAVSHLAPEEKKAATDLLDSLILKHQARRWTGTGRTSSQTKSPTTKAGLRGTGEKRGR